MMGEVASEKLSVVVVAGGGMEHLRIKGREGGREEEREGGRTGGREGGSQGVKR